MSQPDAASRRDFLRRSGAALLSAVLVNRAHTQDGPGAPTVDQWIRHSAEKAPLTMQFRGRTAEECRRWQREFGATLRSLLGTHSPPKTWRVVTERIVPLDDHTRHELVLVADGFPSLPVYLLLPKSKRAKPGPGILALHGHGDFGYDPVAGRDDLPGVAKSIERANYDYGRQLVRRGYVVVTPCFVPFGRRLGDRKAYGSEDPCAVTFVRMQLLGRVLMAENLRDGLWAFEFLSRQKQVDPKRLGCVGLSYGGRMTMLTAALEPRIRVAVISGALNVMQERVSVRYSCGAQVIPGLLKYGDVPEIASLIAPRYCLWEIGSRDGLIKPKWAEDALDRMRRAFRALDAEDRLRVDRFDGGHRWSGRLAYPLLEKVLFSTEQRSEVSNG
jgi:dienelactone hydrolase